MILRENEKMDVGGVKKKIPVLANIMMIVLVA